MIHFLVWLVFNNILFLRFSHVVGYCRDVYLLSWMYNISICDWTKLVLHIFKFADSFFRCVQSTDELTEEILISDTSSISIPLFLLILSCCWNSPISLYVLSVLLFHQIQIHSYFKALVWSFQNLGYVWVWFYLILLGIIFFLPEELSSTFL